MCGKTGSDCAVMPTSLATRGATPKAKKRRVSEAASEALDEWAPEWAPLLSALEDLGSSCDAQLPLLEVDSCRGGAILYALQRVLRLHNAVASADGQASSERLGPVDLSALSASGAALPSLRSTVYERVAASTRHAHSCCESALGGRSKAARSTRGLRSGPPLEHELADADERIGSGSRSPGGGHEDTRSFRDAYMVMLADGAADELDALRREEPPMDEAALATLIDALEHGAETFAPRQRRLIEASFSGGGSWWERRATELEAARSCKAAAGSTPTTPAQSHTQHQSASLVARVRELRGLRPGQRRG